MNAGNDELLAYLRQRDERRRRRWSFDAYPTKVKIGLFATGALMLWPFIERWPG